MGMSLDVYAGYGLRLSGFIDDLDDEHELARKVWSVVDSDPKYEEDETDLYAALEALCSEHSGLDFALPQSHDYTLGVFVFAKSTSQEAYYDSMKIKNLLPTSDEQASLKKVAALLDTQDFGMFAAPSYS